jgi:hypothetical protein
MHSADRLRDKPQVDTLTREVEGLRDEFVELHAMQVRCVPQYFCCDFLPKEIHYFIASIQ